jgi:hypothetical protein
MPAPSALQPLIDHTHTVCLALARLVPRSSIPHWCALLRPTPPVQPRDNVRVCSENGTAHVVMQAPWRQPLPPRAAEWCSRWHPMGKASIHRSSST